MNTYTKFLTLFIAALVLFSLPAAAQTPLVATTLSGAIDAQGRTVPVVSTAGIPVGSIALIDNELVPVTGLGLNLLTVSPRGSNGTLGVAHKSGTMVLAGPPAAFLSYDPSGACTNGQGLFVYTPLVNTRTGNQFLCSSVTGKVAPGFNNTSDVPAPTTVVASAAAKVTPSGPLFHVSGILGITGFNIPVGFDPSSAGQICAIPDAIFTTTAVNNIAIVSTAVVSRVLCWTYDPAAAKFFPSY